LSAPTAAQVLPWLEGSVQGVTHVGIFTLTTATALALYLSSVFTDPGRRAAAARAERRAAPDARARARRRDCLCSVPPNWLPDEEGAAFVEVKKKARRSGGTRPAPRCGG
jgi:hypothetical protein